VKKFTGFPADTDKEEIAVYLIGQLAKNDKYANQISGKDLLDSAFLKIRKSQDIAGGRCTMVESKNLSKLEDFYIENGFSKVREDTDFLLQFMRIIG
jgi:hypothetical protein